MALIIASVALILIGLVFIYKVALVVKICELIKRYVINERILILHSKKIGLFLVLFGILIIGLEVWKATNYNPLYTIHKKYYAREFSAAEKLCLEMLMKQPSNADLWMLLGKIYFAAGKYSQAKVCFNKVLDINSSKHEEVKKYFSLIETKTGGKPK